MKAVAKSLVFDQSGNVLVLRRSATHPKYPQHLDFPGGAVEDDESHHDGARREVIEETGLSMSLNDFELVYQKQTLDDGLHAVYVVVIAEEKPLIELSWEHDKFEWMALDELREAPIPDGVDEYHLTVLEYLRLP